RQSTSTAEARTLHGELAEAFEDAGSALRAGVHWREAGYTDRAAGHFAAAARRAAEALAFDRAAQQYRDALALGNWSEAQRRALLVQAAALFLRGRRFRPRSAEEIAPRDLARVDLCWSISSGLGLMDPVQGAHFQARSLLQALRAGEPSRISRGIAGEAAYAA